MDGKLCCWENPRRTSNIEVCGHKGSISKVISGPNNSAFSCGYDGNIVNYVFPLSSSRVSNPNGLINGTLMGHKSPIIDMSITPGALTGGSNYHLVSGGRDGHVFIWDVETLKPVNKYAKHAASVTKVLSFSSFSSSSSSSSSSSLFLSSSVDGSVYLYDVRVKTSVSSMGISSSKGIASIGCMSLMGDGKSIAIGSSDGRLSLVEHRGGSLEVIESWSDHRGAILSLLVVDETVLFTGGAEGMVLCYDITQEKKRALQYGIAGCEAGGVQELVQVQRNHLVSCGEDGTLLIYEYLTEIE